ncbi:hypothetical protein BH10PSE8_BH10PSE8_14820 [soil metagenome]
MPPRRPANLPVSAAPKAQEPKQESKPVQEQKPVEVPNPASADAPGHVPVGESDPSCLAALIAAHGSDVRAARLEPKPEAACAVVEPVVVEALTIGADSDRRRVALQPAVTLSCAMATSVTQWLETSVLPLVKGHFSRDLTALRVGGGHECRRRNRSANGQLSEHATGRALDVFAFVIGDGKTGDSRLGDDKTGNGKTANGKIDGTVVVEKPEGELQRLFLTAIRQSACGAFMTSLGPGSDAAHANHLHVDIQQRRSAASRFCQ